MRISRVTLLAGYLNDQIGAAPAQYSMEESVEPAPIPLSARLRSVPALAGAEEGMPERYPVLNGGEDVRGSEAYVSYYLVLFTPKQFHNKHCRRIDFPFFILNFLLGSPRVLGLQY